MNKKLIKSLLLSALLLLVVFAFVGVIVFEVTKPLDAHLSASVIQDRVQNQDRGAVLSRADGAYFETDPSSDFAKLFSFGDWERINSLSGSGELLLSLNFAESWIVDLYSDGQVEAYNGYAPVGTKSHAFYNVPAGTADRLIDYIEDNGTPRTFLTDAIGSAAFYH